MSNLTFLAIGRHGAVDPAEGRRVAELGLPWLDDRVADGTFDGVWSMEGGGRLLIAHAASEADLRALLDGAPDVPREWQITQLYDGREVIRHYLATTPADPAG
jgi:hypothetical protein